MVRRTIVVTMLVGALLAGTAGIASAHECNNVSRNANGTAGAAGSNGWMRESLSDIFGFLIFVADNNLEAQFGLPELPARSPSQIPAMVTAAIAAGVPADGFLVLVHATAAGGLEGHDRNGVLANGRGIDHFPEVYGRQLIGAYISAGA